jgi:hypothetical protein
MKVTKAEGSQGATYSEIDLELPEGTPQSIQRKVKRDVGDYLVEQIYKTTSAANSPVSGESFPPLSKEYAKEKQRQGGSGKPDLTLQGDMLDALEASPTADGVEVGIYGDQAWKADGHLKFSGEENGIPKRRFLPGEGQQFTSDIQGEVEKIIADNLLEADLDPEDLRALEDVSSAEELYQVLEGFFPDMAKVEIRAAVMRSQAFSEMLDSLDLLEFL